MPEFVDVSVAEGVATVRIDRPPLNALNAALQRELRAATERAAVDDDIRAVVLYGGPAALAVGADIEEFDGLDYAAVLAGLDDLTRAFDQLAELPKPVVAAVGRYALGGGCELALTADVRICGTTSVFGLPEILLGLIPGGGGTQRLPMAVGAARAKELIFTGREVGADEALRIGLVDRVVADDDVYPAAVELAARFAAGPSVALRAAKVAVNAGLAHGPAVGARLERELFAALFGTEDKDIGVRSYFANGPGQALFVGR
jgi:enoyl-CoA hydratase